MSIALVVTRGYGNGTLTGAIADVATRGYTIGAAIAAAIGDICLSATDARIAVLSAIDARIAGLSATWNIDSGLDAVDARLTGLAGRVPSC